MSEINLINPIYQQIAIDIASMIAKDEYIVGSKLFGRSTLAGKYNVSPETVRRAIKLLEDVNIVKVNAGVGIIINSKEDAIKFIQKFQVTDSVKSVKNQIIAMMDNRNMIEEQINQSIKKLLDYSERFHHTNPFEPFEIKILDNSDLINKTIEETNFWQNTGATIIGIRRNGQVILSPGPYAIFMQNDYVIIIGNETSYNRCYSYLNNIR